MLVPPLGRCVAHVGGVRQVMPPWPGSWVVPMPAPWCVYWCGAGVAFVAVHGAAELWCMVVSWFWLHRSSGTHDGVSYWGILVNVVDVVVIHGGGGAICFVCPPPVGEFDGVKVVDKAIHVVCNSCFVKKRIPLHRLRCRGMLFQVMALAHTGTGPVVVDAHDGYDALFDGVRGFRAEGRAGCPGHGPDAVYGSNAIVGPVRD